MAFLATSGAVSLLVPLHLVSSSRRRSVIPMSIKATANSSSTPPHPILSSLRLAASAAVLLAATSPALACTQPPSPPTPSLAPTSLTATVSPDDASHPFEELIFVTTGYVRLGGVSFARERLSSAAPAVRESCARLLAAQALLVDGKLDEAIAAFEELVREDPSDYRPLFCQAMLYCALGRTEELVSVLTHCFEVAGDKVNPEFSRDSYIFVTSMERLAQVFPPMDAVLAEDKSGAENVEPQAVKV